MAEKTSMPLVIGKKYQITATPNSEYEYKKIIFKDKNNKALDLSHSEGFDEQVETGSGLTVGKITFVMNSNIFAIDAEFVAVEPHEEPEPDKTQDVEVGAHTENGTLDIEPIE